MTMTMLPFEFQHERGSTKLNSKVVQIVTRPTETKLGPLTLHELHIQSASDRDAVEAPQRLGETCF
jgi:hypothetical protein